MKTLARSVPRLLPLAIASLRLLTLGSCQGPTNEPLVVLHDPGAELAPSEGTGQQVAKIIGGTSASGFPEVALIDIYQGGQLVAFCSGSVIAAQVAMTAGHC